MKKLEKKRGSQALLLVVVLLCVLSLMTSLRHCSRPPSGTEKQRTASGGDTIDVAISYSPMTLYRYADTLGGFSYDMLRALSASHGFIFKYHPVTSMDQALDGLGDGLYDVVVADVAKTVDFDSGFAFTDEVYLDHQVLVQRRDSVGNVSVGSQLELAGKQVWVENSSPALLRLKHLAEEIGDTIFVRTVNDYNSEQLFLMTALGEIPMAVVNRLVAQKLSADYPQIDISTSISFTQFQSWLTRSADKSLIGKLNEAIKEFKSTDDYDILVERYK